MEAPLYAPTGDVLAVTLMRRTLRQVRRRWPHWIGEVCFSRIKSLMTGRIVLESTAGEHLSQKLAAMDDLLGLGIVVEPVLRHA